MAQFSVASANEHLVELIQKALLGEEIFIEQEDHRAMVKIVPTRVAPLQHRLGTAKKLIQIAPDFDAPLEVGLC